jgi:hypothetical protein
MKHEKITTRPDGSQLKIEVQIIVDFFRQEYKYSTACAWRDKGKRKWIWAPLSEATNEEIYSAKLELWEKLKPIQLPDGISEKY